MCFKSLLQTRRAQHPHSDASCAPTGHPHSKDCHPDREYNERRELDAAIPTRIQPSSSLVSLGMTDLLWCEVLTDGASPSSAFHVPSSAFHAPSSAFHAPSSAFHASSSAFHAPLAGMVRITASVIKLQSPKSEV